MTDIIRPLYSGEIYPDDEVIPRDKEYRSTLEKIKKEREYLKNTLSSGDYEHLKTVRRTAFSIFPDELLRKLFLRLPAGRSAYERGLRQSR